MGAEIGPPALVGLPKGTTMTLLTVVGIVFILAGGYVFLDGVQTLN